MNKNSKNFFTIFGYIYTLDIIRGKNFSYLWLLQVIKMIRNHIHNRLIICNVKWKTFTKRTAKKWRLKYICLPPQTSDM